MPSLRMDYVTCAKNATDAIPLPRKLWLILARELLNPLADGAEGANVARVNLGLYRECPAAEIGAVHLH